MSDTDERLEKLHEEKRALIRENNALLDKIAANNDRIKTIRMELGQIKMAEKAEDVK